ncbi:MAG: hypothetical protein H0V17_34235 [Deltaproteobacteria bacterium]|nr:hypothetical protein [Deltaproteobacteria bacterium]
MRALPLVVALAACGGGASIDVSQPTAIIVDANCDRTTQSSFLAMIEYEVTLAVGQAITPEISFFSDPNDPAGSVFENLGCGGWTPFRDDTCTRGVGQPTTVTIVHTYNQNVGGSQLPVPTTLFVTANPLDSPGSFSLGSGDTEEVNCQ